MSDMVTYIPPSGNAATHSADEDGKYHLQYVVLSADEIKKLGTGASG